MGKNGISRIAAVVLLSFFTASQTVSAKYSGGSGEPGDPYQIANVADLMILSADANDYNNCFIMTANINLDPCLPGNQVFTTAVIAPDINGENYLIFDGTPFAGTFNGNGFTIQNLTIQWPESSPAYDYFGLFGQLGNGAHVRNLGVVDVNFRQVGTSLPLRSFAGALAGENNGGAIEQCYSTGYVKGHHYRGGLVGRNNAGTIRDCYSHCTVIKAYPLSGAGGGLVGGNGTADAIIINCFSTGLVGNGGGLISPDYNYGTVTGSFWDVNTSGRTTSGGGTGKTTAEMQTQSTFTDAGWDFIGEIVNGPNDVWTICEGATYPKLAWQFVPFDFTDFADMGLKWLQPDSTLYCGGSDLTGDGIVDFADFAGLAQGWLVDCRLVLPGQAYNPNPANEATDVSVITDLGWTSGPFATSHDVYFGTVTPPPFIKNQTGTTYDTGTMDANTTYYWRIDEKNTVGTTTGILWIFATGVVLPGQASNPSPTNGATGIGISAVSWTAGNFATSHDVYFGTTNPPLFIRNQAETTFDTGVMEVNTTYYWRIDEKNGSGITIGDIWNFKTLISEFKLTASDGTSYDCFGNAVSISGNRCLVGSEYDDDMGAQSGSAYIYEWNGTNWIQQAKLTASDGAANDHFGNAVSISGDRCIVGVMYDDDKGVSSGSAYIFEWNGINWTQTAKLTASDGADSDYFGCAVSISGDNCIVGSYHDDDFGSDSGSAYIYEWNGTSWTQQTKLTASDGASSDYFGFTVSISGDRCIVGAIQDDDKGSNSGSAYVFVRNGSSWIQQAKLTASDGAAGDWFGFGVSISGDRCIVGADSDDDMGSYSGSAYIYEWNGTSWIQQAKLTASDGASLDCFGHRVGISGDRCIVGAIDEYTSSENSGSAYIYEWNGTTWIQQAKLTGAANDNFGNAVSISGDRCIVGAYSSNDMGSHSGSAYIYDLGP